MEVRDADIWNEGPQRSRRSKRENKGSNESIQSCGDLKFKNYRVKDMSLLHCAKVSIAHFDRK